MRLCSIIMMATARHTVSQLRIVSLADHVFWCQKNSGRILYRESGTHAAGWYRAFRDWPARRKLRRRIRPRLLPVRHALAWLKLITDSETVLTTSMDNGNIRLKDDDDSFLWQWTFIFLMKHFSQSIFDDGILFVFFSHFNPRVIIFASCACSWNSALHTAWILRSYYHTALAVHHVPDHDFRNILFHCICYFCFTFLYTSLDNYCMPKTCFCDASISCVLLPPLNLKHLHYLRWCNGD